MGVTQHLHPGPAPGQLQELLTHRSQEVVGIGRVQRLKLQPAGDQGTVIVKRTAQPQLEREGLALPPSLR